MPRAKQLRVTVTDRTGFPGETPGAHGANKININGMTAAAMEGGGMLWMVVDKTAAAKRALAARGWKTTEAEVLAVTLSDTPGALGRFATKLGKAGVNITFAYVGSAGSARKLTGYFGDSDLKAALQVRP